MNSTAVFLDSAFIVHEFTYNRVHYKVILSPELYPDEGGLDFTGNYNGILISSNRGSKVFELYPDAHLRWEPNPKGMDPGIIDELDKIITAFRQQH